MPTVTQIVNQLSKSEIRQNYITIRSFKHTHYNNQDIISEIQSIKPNTVGIVVDYLTRYKLTHDVKQAFEIPLLVDNEFFGAVSELTSKITTFNKQAIDIAIDLVKYDTYYRAGIDPSETPSHPKLSTEEYNTIAYLINRSANFIKACVTDNTLKTDVTFEGAYNEFVTNGDADYMTKDVLIDLKVSKYPPSEAYAMQLLIYYVMGLNSINSVDFYKLKYLAIFNPKLNTAYTLPVNEISNETIHKVEMLLGYEDPQTSLNL